MAEDRFIRLQASAQRARVAFNRAFAGAGLDWHWDQALYDKLLAVTGGKERIRYFIEDFGGEGAPADSLAAFIPALHAPVKPLFSGSSIRRTSG